MGCSYAELFTPHGQSIDADSGSRYRTAEFQVVGDFRDVEKEVFQISGDRNFLDGVRQLAVRDPEAGRTAGVVSRYQIHALPKEFCHVEAFFDLSDQLLRGFRARLQEIVSWSNTRSTGKPARGVGRGLQSQLLGGVGVEQIRFQYAIFDHDRTARGNALSIEGGCAKPAGDRAVVDDVYSVSRDLLPQLTGQKRRTAINRIPIDA